jgi:hypothetical protein
VRRLLLTSLLAAALAGCGGDDGGDGSVSADDLAWAERAASNQVPHSRVWKGATFAAGPTKAGEICVDRRLAPLSSGFGVAPETHVFVTPPDFTTSQPFDGPCPG